MRKKITLALLSLLLVPLGMMAQNVTVHPGNGSMLPALKAGQEDTFFGWNGFATWKHEQLSLTLTTGDSDNNSGTDADGQLARPANDIFKSADGTCLQIGKGNYLNTYLTVSLPKGYRFTGYTIQFHRIPSPNGKPSNEGAEEYTGSIAFGEINNAFGWRSTINTTESNITTYRGGIGQGTTTKYTIGRTSQTATDMENVLYFMLYNNSQNGRAFIQLDHVEFYFTAENNYTPLIPAPNVTERSAVDIPFTTSKMDYGKLKRYNKSGQEVQTGGRVSYDGTIHDMNANLILYENGSVESVTDNGFDGTAGNIVKYQSGSISQAGDYFKLDASKHGQKDKPISETGATSAGEVIYYIESPIWATNSAAANAHKNPIGYRIIGADFDYTGGNVKFPAVFKIQYESTGHSADQNGTYGLNLYNGAIAYNWNYQSEWRIDDDGYIYNGQYYLQTGNSNTSTTLSVTTTKPSASRGTFEIVTNNGVKQIRRKSNTSYYIGWNEDESYWTGAITRTAVMTNNSNRRATYNELSHAFSENIGQYTFNIYDKTGTRVEKTVTVNGNSGTLSIDGLNNDAVKIGVIGKGVIRGHIIMQALDPYIDRMDIVCQEQGGNGGKLTQQFNATDFSVRGGQFTFYVPEDFKAPARFTFENLYSQYGDNTYYNETSSTDHARYFFMGSTYGDSNANVYGRSESASYTTKVACLKPGDKKFTFNNAATATANPGTQYEEYPFSKALYASKVNGSFNDYFEFSQDEMGTTPATVKTAYLFTCDETRYNIAPTTATQHVYYAFYEMKIDMKKKTYAPIFTWEPVYAKDKTFYGDNKTDAMFGLKVTTESVTDDQGTHSGYVTVSQIKDNIASNLTGGTNAPSSLDQILYIDASNLMSIVENQTATTSGTYTSHTVGELMTGLAKNALIYLPYGSKPSNDNFAYNTIAKYGETPIFRGAKDIVLTDKQPFYSKFDIQVGSENYARYQRLITTDSYGKVQNASLIIPFALTVDGGTHTNPDGTSFSLHTMQSSKALRVDDNQVVAFFPELSGASTAAANTPYLVQLSQNSTEDNVSFVVTQKGGSIAKTTGMASDYTISGVASTGVVVDNASAGKGTWTFTPQGTYAGQQVPKANNIFYFAKNIFVSSMDYKYGDIKIFPFRAYYATSSSNGAKLSSFVPVFEEGEGDEITAIAPATAVLDVNAPVYDLQGRMVAPTYREAKSLQSGMYVVNGVKIIVK